MAQKAIAYCGNRQSRIVIGSQREEGRTYGVAEKCQIGTAYARKTDVDETEQALGA